MNTLIFHKNFLPMTGVRFAQVSISSVSDIQAYLELNFPKLSNHIKTNKTVKCAYILNGISMLPKHWVLHNKIYDTNATIYIVPSIQGGDAVTSALASVTSQGISEFITKAVIGFTINVALSYVIQALMPKVKKTNEYQDRIDNDMFGGIQNTQDPSIPVALNYGMVRLGGQLISAEIETITDQKLSDPTVEVSLDDVSDPNSRYNIGGGGSP